MDQDRVFELARAHRLDSRPIEINSDGSPFAVLARENIAGRYFQATLKQMSVDRFSCHVGLYGPRCLIDDGEIVVDGLEAAVKSAAKRILLLERSC